MDSKSQRKHTTKVILSDLIGSLRNQTNNLKAEIRRNGKSKLIAVSENKPQSNSQRIQLFMLIVALVILVGSCFSLNQRIRSTNQEVSELLTDQRRTLQNMILKMNKGEQKLATLMDKIEQQQQMLNKLELEIQKNIQIGQFVEIRLINNENTQVIGNICQVIDNDNSYSNLLLKKLHLQSYQPKYLIGSVPISYRKTNKWTIIETYHNHLTFGLFTRDNQISYDGKTGEIQDNNKIMKRNLLKIKKGDIIVITIDSQNGEVLFNINEAINIKYETKSFVNSEYYWRPFVRMYDIGDKIKWE